MRVDLRKKKFGSEAEEAEWWFTHQGALANEFEKAAKDGTLGHGTVARIDSTPTIMRPRRTNPRVQPTAHTRKDGAPKRSKRTATAE
jgi:hypothetical protein